MPNQSRINQPDLFGDLDQQPQLFDADDDFAKGIDRRPYYEQAPKFLIDFHREQFQAEFARVKASTAFPWRDLTKAMQAEMKFNSEARTLYPRDQADAMRVEYAVEIARVYKIIEEPWMPLIYAVPDR